MSTPTIPAGNLYMNATLYTGNGTNQTIINGVAGQQFTPDMVWIKGRNNTWSHWLQDSVRGYNYLLVNTTNAESPNSSHSWSTSGATTNGFNVYYGDNGSINNNGDTYVGWNWKAGGTAVSNTAGTITSQVSANTTSGFSIVTYTGNGTNLATVGHGVGAAPYFVIIRRRDTGQNWLVDISNITGTTGNVLTLNTTNAVVTSTTIAPVKPSSTVLTLGTDGLSNASGGTYVAYCWAPIAGYSQFGSYTGNGSADGPFIYTGFRPRFLMIKSSSQSGTAWLLLDSSRDPYNQGSDGLQANSSNADSLIYYFDFLSNGFKIRQTTGYDMNNSGQTYIYAAFAEVPFKFANGR